MSKIHIVSPKKGHEPEILHPKKYLASKFPTQKKKKIQVRLSYKSTFYNSIFFWNSHVAENSLNDLFSDPLIATKILL